MENLTDFVNASLPWLIGALESILSWSIICVQTIASVVYFLYIAVVRVAIAASQWLVTSLQWLFNIIATFCDWLITSLGIAENGIPYIFCLI
ncbi:hypothetical protein FNW02_15660 [Komarekiella sp. 'clone 1']|uniref:Uncharacterized protein n=1 Tax=Komarekiella delphini-convector SJRDD-AB1 TaxID=2593771 RepID=A0AA40SYC9_9NOST|nr:hypothetical protein [Komarekiella delphini-convector]MBD6617230.1 hypothetical protein [Komarekiella delphini-convector SJRDD-AB1]